MKKLYIYIKPFIVGFSIAIILKGLGAFLELVVPNLMGTVIDEGIANNDVKLIIMLSIAMLAVALLSFGANIVGNYLSSKATQAMGENMRNALFSHIQDMTTYHIEKISTASLITRVTNDVEHVQRTLLMLTRFMIRAPITAIGGVVLSIMIDPYLTFIIFVSMIILGIVSGLVYKITMPIYRKVQVNIDKLTGILRENLSGIRIIKAFGKSDYETGRFHEQSKKVKKYELKAGKINAYMSPSIALVSNITVIVILYVSGYRVEAGAIKIGEVVTILNYINMILMAMTTVPRMFMLFSRANTSSARINEVLDVKEKIDYGNENTSIDDTTVLEFENVHFSYPQSSTPALKNINFSIKKGETLGVIGATGSGKTTILNLMLRLYVPSSGNIILEGRDIAKYDKDYLTNIVTAAMQQYNIFGMSIKENIMLDMDYDYKRLEKSTETAQVNELIKGLEEGFDHTVSQNGTNLSGGQKQRISVARTLYRKANVVILDDVSSALDYKTDLNLRNALRENYIGKTVVLISQRISSIRASDKILVLDRGKQVGLGTHEELIKTCQIYKDICVSQHAL